VESVEKVKEGFRKRIFLTIYRDCVRGTCRWVASVLGTPRDISSNTLEVGRLCLHRNSVRGKRCEGCKMRVPRDMY
jgi:hypothetical protein